MPPLDRQNGNITKPIACPQRLLVEKILPVRQYQPDDNKWFIDFGRAAFGTLQMKVTAERPATLTVHLGEKLDSCGRLDRTPPGSVRYRKIPVKLTTGRQTIRVQIPPDERNTGPAAIHMPDELFEVMPFRYAEVTATDPSVSLVETCQPAVFYPFNDAAAEFDCDDDRLNRVWELCKYSIKATSFCGVYVDGDRERIPYEADAYINQLCHYGVDAEYELARHTFEILLRRPTWPTEWAMHFIPMAWADYQYTGRSDLLEAYYEQLAGKALLPLAREDALISTETGLVSPNLLEELGLDKNPAFKPQQLLRDLIDWPPGSFTQGGTGERDNYHMVAVKTVINAFHAWNLELLGNIAEILGNPENADFYRQRYKKVVKSLHRVCFDTERGIFTDGEGSDHASLHANLFPAAFGLLPKGSQDTVSAFIKSRGMACSVYGAQYLLEACFRLGEPDYALELMTADHDRGWLNMLCAGSTITWEAWDHRYKNNLDWNHAWGAAPANIIPRFVVGVKPAHAGFQQALIAPQVGCLERIEAKVPTPKGPIALNWHSASKGKSRLFVQTPVPAKLDTSGLLSALKDQKDSPDIIRHLPAGNHEIIIP